MLKMIDVLIRIVSVMMLLMRLSLMRKSGLILKKKNMARHVIDGLDSKIEVKKREEV